MLFKDLKWSKFLNRLWLFTMVLWTNRIVSVRLPSVKSTHNSWLSLQTPTLAAGVAAASLVRTIAHRERLLEMHLPTPLRTPSTFTCNMGKVHTILPLTNTTSKYYTSTQQAPIVHYAIIHRAALSSKRSVELATFSAERTATRANKILARTGATVSLRHGLARDANGYRRRLRETGPRVSGRGCGNRFGAIPVTKIIGTASAPQRRDATRSV